MTITGEFVGLKTRAILAAVPLGLCLFWVIAHLLAVVDAVNVAQNDLALSWLVSFMLLWWAPLAWFEKPFRANAEQQRELDRLKVTVQIPVYNEDETALGECLRSILAQSRRVERIRVVDDGSVCRATGTPMNYAGVREEFLVEAEKNGIEATWDRTANRGKRYAQMQVLADDDGDIFVTLDSDSVLDRHAVREGLKPFSDPKVKSVAGLVAVRNSRANVLTWMSCVLYLQFTRGVRSAQSVLRRVTINSGTLAFYRAEVVRKYAGVYENERFCDRPMQMNDDSMLTFYGLLDGDTVQQPSAIVFTLVPERLRHYVDQQIRWMRGTTVRHLWWLRYMPLRGVVFWSAMAEYLHLLLSIMVPVVLLLSTAHSDLPEVGMLTITIALIMHYLMSLRLFILRRSDESRWITLLMYVTSPVVALWRPLVLRPIYLYSVLTCRKINKWGTRDGIEVRAPQPSPG